MRTPGHDEELALGFCLSEGLRPHAARLPDDLAANTVDVEAPGFDPARLQRSFYTSSSCGVCGKGALEAVAVEAARVESQLRVAARARRRRCRTGCARRRRRSRRPAACTRPGLFAADGELLCAREDVGRHNAMDKVIGWAFGEGRLPLADAVLCVSGRLSFELVQKAAVAGCPMLVAVGAPSSLAVELARDRGITLCGFVRGGRDERLHRGVADRRADGRPARRRREHAASARRRRSRELGGETLAERAWRAARRGVRRAASRSASAATASTCRSSSLDDGTDVRAPIAGLVAGLRAATHEIARRAPGRHAAA